MTFYEAALRVLEAAGQPLTSVEITERSIAQGLLSHVGKTPEQTMLSRLAAMARRARDRRVTVTGPDTFALTDWSLPEDAPALEAMSAPYEHPEEGLPPLRPVERHPEPRGDNVRGVGRQERRRRQEEEERGKKRRYPPVSEVAFELLGEADAPLALSEVLRLARERQLTSDELQPEALLTHLAEENQRRIDAGRRPTFALDATGALMLEHDDLPVADVQSAFARALDLPFTDGRIAFRHAAPSAAPEALADDGLVHAAKSAVKEARRATARALRSHLASLEQGTLEKACVKMLHALHFREIKVAKRGNHGQLLTARRKDGSLELRWAIRIHRGNGPVDRRAVQDCRKDLHHQSAHTSLLIATGDLRSDARTEALNGAPVHVWVGEGLAEKFLESHSGVRVVSLELFELDPAFFEEAARGAEESRRRREERHREREERTERTERPEPSAPAEPAEASAEEEDLEDEGEDEGPEETGPEGAAAGPEGAGGPPGEAGSGERKRRRRRRRGRRGRGREGAPGTPGAEQAAGGAPEGEAPSAEPPAEPAVPPSESPSGGGQSSTPEQG
ncbi:MAG TPA: HTH domain-containing protein [Myxococcaceae bacterium]